MKKRSILNLPDAEKRLNKHFGGTRRENVDSWALLFTLPEFIKDVQAIRKAYKIPKLTWDEDAFDEHFERSGGKFVRIASQWIENLRPEAKEAYQLSIKSLVTGYKLPGNTERAIEEFVLYDNPGIPPFFNAYVEDAGISNGKVWTLIKVFAWLDPKHPEMLESDLKTKLLITLHGNPFPINEMPVLEVKFDEEKNFLEIIASCKNDAKEIEKFIPKIAKRTIELAGEHFKRHDYLEKPTETIAIVKTIREKLGKPGSETIKDVALNYLTEQPSKKALTDDAEWESFAKRDAENQKKAPARTRKILSRYRKQVKDRFGRDTKI
jgi:hypothetical protein